MTEKQLVKEIKEYLKGIGFFFKTHGGPYQMAGVSDLIGCVPPVGRFMAIEVKLPGKKLTRIQEVFLDDIRKAGGVAIMATSVDDVKRLVDFQKMFI
jgi:VRR-NUC domain-containing protein